MARYKDYLLRLPIFLDRGPIQVEHKLMTQQLIERIEGIRDRQIEAHKKAGLPILPKQPLDEPSGSGESYEGQNH